MNNLLFYKFKIRKSISLFISILIIVLSQSISTKIVLGNTIEYVYKLSFNNYIKGYFKAKDINRDNLLVKSEITEIHLDIESFYSNFECDIENLKEFIYHIPNMTEKTGVNNIYIDCSSKDLKNSFIIDTIKENNLLFKNKYTNKYKETYRQNNTNSFSWSYSQGISEGDRSISISVDPSYISIEKTELKTPAKTNGSDLKQNCDNSEYMEIDSLEYYVYCILK